MQTLTGVVTTGIYCREGCPATPLRRNTLPFGHSAAAGVVPFADAPAGGQGIGKWQIAAAPEFLLERDNFLIQFGGGIDFTIGIQV